MGNTNSKSNNQCRLCEGYAPKNEWFCAQCCTRHGCIAIFEELNGIEAISMNNGFDNFQRRGLIRYFNIPDVIQQHTLSKPYRGEDQFMQCLAKELQQPETIHENVLRIVRKFMNDAGLTWNYVSTCLMD